MIFINLIFVLKKMSIKKKKKNSYANVTELKNLLTLATLNTNSIQPSYYLQKKVSIL